MFFLTDNTSSRGKQMNGGEGGSVYMERGGLSQMLLLNEYTIDGTLAVPAHQAFAPSSRIFVTTPVPTTSRDAC